MDEKTRTMINDTLKQIRSIEILIRDTKTSEGRGWVTVTNFILLRTEEN